MRNAFAGAISDLAAHDGRVVLLMGDIGNHLFDAYKERFPERFFNCGVAEANMIGMAAGMASAGLRPVCYTIAPFITSRCLEQIRVDLCYHRMPALIVGTGAGLSYASLGATHHSCEDIAMLRVLPEMTVLCPGDPMEVRACVRAASQEDGPVYMRIGKKGEPTVHEAAPELRIGKCLRMKHGATVAILTAGNTLPLAMDVAARLDARGLSAEVASFHTVKPLDEEYLHDVCSRCPVIATLEEHSIAGGFGSAVAEWMSAHDDATSRLVRFGTADRFLHAAGDQAYAREQYGLTPANVVAGILGKLR